MRNARVQDACLLGSDHRLILAIDRFEALLGDAKRPTGAAEPKQYSDLGSDRCSQLLADAGGGTILSMERDRTQQATPDPFSTAASFGEPSPPAKQVLSAQERRHVLPKDLPNAVKHLDDRELDLLITASLEEAKRRDRSLPNVQANIPDQSLRQRSSQMATSSRGRQVEVAPVSLTRGQVNAVRAAAKAGIKPSVIARQFGISQSDVRKVLAADTVCGAR